MEEASIPEGTVIGGRWRIQGFLGAGGFGQVLLAEDTSEVALGQAAVKILHPNTTPQERQAFLGEVKKIAVLRHQNLVGYLDSGQLHFDGIDLPDLGGEIRPYLVTELCQGSLDDHISNSPTGTLSADETFVVLRDIAGGLSHLHERGMIHRDIKPGNVLYADGQWKLADFGLMRDLSASGTYHRGELLIGTPLFMAPELFSTMMATAPSDVYAVGVLAHLCATGRPLHSGAGAALVHNISTAPPSIDPSLEPRLGELIRFCTQAQADARPTADQLSQRLQTPTSPTAQPGFGSAPATQVASQPAPLEAAAQWPAPAPGTDRSSLPNPPQHAAAAPRPAQKDGRTALLVALGAVVVLLASGLLGGVMLLRGNDAGELDAAGQSAGGEPVSDADSGSENDSGNGVEVGDGLEVGDGVEVGDDVEIGDGDDTNSPVTTAAEELTDVRSHFDDPPCVAGGAVNQVRITNRHSVPVDYRLTIKHFNDTGVEVAEAFDTVRALPAGQSALLGMKSSDEGSTSCEVATFTAAPTDPGILATMGEAQIVSCILDEFFGNWYDIIYTVGNPTAETVIAETAFGIIDADGVRIDESSSDTVFGVDPGARVQQEANEVFWNMDEVEQAPVECIITWVEIERDPSG